MRKKGKVEWLYKISTLQEDGTIGYDYITTETRLGKNETREFAEALQTDVRIDFIGTIILPPKNVTEIFTHNTLTKEEREKRIKIFQEKEKQFEKNLQ